MRPSILGLVAAALSGAVAVLYLVLIVQGAVGYEGAEAYVAGVALLFAGQSMLTAVAALRRSAPLLALSAVLLLATGALALFSIGAPLILASLFAAAGAVRAWVRPPPRDEGTPGG